jgi:hypothetical protein
MKRRRAWLLLALLLLVPVLAALSPFLSHDNRPLVSNAGDWKSSRNFQRAEPEVPFVYADPDEARHADYWVVGQYFGRGSGQLASPPFEAPAWISLIVTGDLTRPGNEVYFRPVDEDKRLRVFAHTQPYFWRQVVCRVPSDWVGKPIRLVAEAGPRTPENWFGLSNPRALGTGTVLLSHLSALAVLPAYAVGLLLFLLPGFPLALRLAAAGRIQPFLVLPVTIVFSCLAGYLTFWAYVFDLNVGFHFRQAVLLAGAALLFVFVRGGHAIRSLALSAEVWIPLTLTALVGAFYLALTYSVNLWVPLSEVPQLRFLDFTLPRDNDIPYFFADRLYNGFAPHGILIGEWHYSDRPPLQAGLLLIQLAFGYLIDQPGAYSFAVGVALQCAWVPAVWAMCRAAGLTQRRAGLVVLFVSLTGFALVNTVFTWPKLLAAALTVIAVTLALFDRGLKGHVFPLAKAALLGLSAALAFLAHGSVAFTLLPLGLLLLTPRYYPGLSRLVVAGVAFAATVYPWMLFQSRYDPPGNLLVYQHIAGRSPAWDDAKPLWRNLLDAYEGLSAGQILENKRANMRVLFMASRKPAPDQFPWPPDGAPEAWPVDAAALRRCEFMCLFWAPGLLNIGWVVAVAAAGRRRAVLDPGLGYVVPALGLSGVLTWVVVMFGPGSTVIHQGSYATVLLFMAAPAAWLTTLSNRTAYLLLFLQGTLFTFGWLLTSPANDYGLPNFVVIPLAIVFFVLLVRVALVAGPGEAVPPAADHDVTARDRQNRGKLPGRRR